LLLPDGDWPGVSPPDVGRTILTAADGAAREKKAGMAPPLLIVRRGEDKAWSASYPQKSDVGAAAVAGFLLWRFLDFLVVQYIPGYIWDEPGIGYV
jgi:hypothetical protein